jgi:DNA-binding LacI/PurR family transcriptional regulator
MAAKSIRIAIHADILQEAVQRRLGGMLRFAHEHTDILFCDQRVPLYGQDARMTDPPWTGLVDGVVLGIGLAKKETAEDVVKWIMRGEVPAVSTAADILHPRIPLVCLEVASIAHLAADHLIQCGCRRFMHVGFAMSMGSRRRAEAFRKALAERGFDMAEYDFIAKIEEGDGSRKMDNDVRNITPLLKATPHPLGVLALGDPFARAVWRISDTLGLQVPAQVAIVGVNDTPLAFAQRPTLTSVCYPGEEVG